MVYFQLFPVLILCLILVSLFVLLPLAQLCLSYLVQFASSLILRYKPKNDLCTRRRVKKSGSDAGNCAPRHSNCVSRVHENLWMWILFSVLLCI